MSAAQNEQRKLSANLPNTLAGGLMITGGLAPLIAFLLGVVIAPGWLVGSLAGFCLFTGVGLHFAGRRLLRGLVL